MKCLKCGSRLRVFGDASYRHGMLHYKCRNCGAILRYRGRPVRLYLLLAIAISVPLEFVFVLLFGHMVESFPALEMVVSVALFAVIFYFLMARSPLEEVTDTEATH